LRAAANICFYVFFLLSGVTSLLTKKGQLLRYTYSHVPYGAVPKYMCYVKACSFISAMKNTGFLTAKTGITWQVEGLYMSDIHQILSQTWLTDGIEIAIVCFLALCTPAKSGGFQTGKEYFKLYHYILYSQQGVLRFLANIGK